MYKKILITGGAGFLGSHLCNHLLNQNYEIVILDDFSNGHLYNLNGLLNNKNLIINTGDVTKKEDVKEAVKGCQVVVHLAVLDLRESIKNPSKVVKVITEGTLNCLEAALSENVKLFVNCSSSEVYGSAQQIPMNESHPLNPETPYAAAKVSQDALVHSFGKTYNLNWITIRPFNMYGPHSHWAGFRGELLPRMIVTAMNRKCLTIFGDGSQTRDFIYVEDVAKTITKLIETPKTKQQINICSGKEISVVEIARIICEHFQLNPEHYIRFLPKRPADVMRHLGDNTKLRTLYKIDSFCRIKDGIQKTIDWIKSLNISPEEMMEQLVEKNW